MNTPFFRMSRTGMRLSPGAATVIPVKVQSQRTEPEQARLQAICAACKWNVNWICEHPGCLPCQQRQSGGLKKMIVSPNFHCTAGYFKLPQPSQPTAPSASILA
jgi:hypothetical protein